MINKLKVSISFILILNSFSFFVPSLGKEYSVENKLKVLNSNVDKKNYSSEYILGIGDEILINFQGIEIFSKVYEINAEGYIVLPEIFKYYAAGKTITELENELTEKYEEIIISPNIDISINRYRPVYIYISGEVKLPGLFKLDYKETVEDVDSDMLTVPRVFDALKLSKGVTNNADLSKVIIIRNNSKNNGGSKIKAEIDLLSMILYGDQSQNIRLMDGDHIEITKSEKPLKEQIMAINKSNLTPNKINVFITGNVERRGSISITKGSSLNQAIASSGGKKIMTGDIEFIRFNYDGTTKKDTFEYNSQAKINTKRNPILMEGDIINVKRTNLGVVTEVVKEFAMPLLAISGIFDIFE